MLDPPGDLWAALRGRSGAKWSEYGPAAVPAWVADMDFPVAPAIAEAVERYHHVGDFGYADRAAPDRVVAALVEWVADRHGWSPDPADAAVTGDVMQAVAGAIQVFTEPGDGVIIQTPIYPPFLEAVETAGRRVLAHPLREGSYGVDLPGLDIIASDAAMVLLANPHNPSGRVFTRTELDGIAAAASRHGLIVVSDEIHADLVYAPHRHLSIGTFEAVAEHTITLLSASKAFNIAGIGCGVALFGSPDLARRFADIPANLLGHPRALGMKASVAAWTREGAWLDATMAALRANRDHVVQWAGDRPLRLREPEATYLAWLDFRPLGWAGEPADVLLEAGVALSRGPRFGPGGGGFARLNFATFRPVLDEILRRIDTAL